MSPQFVSSVDFPKNPNPDSYLDLLRQKAAGILKANVYRGKTDTGYTAASGKMIPEGETKPRFLYPFQWLWDTFFIAGWSPDIAQSITDVNKFLASQAENGFLGHIRYNREILARKEYFPPPNIYYPDGIPSKGEITSKITQPPNVAYGIWQLAKKITDKKKRHTFLEDTFPKAFKFHQYLYGNLVKDGLLVTIHPWQAGDDNSPKWDQIYSSIKVKNIHQKVVGFLKSLDLDYDRVDVKIIHHTQRPLAPDYDIYLYLIWLYNQWDWDEKTILSRSPFRIHDPLTNSVLQRSNRCLLSIARELKENKKAETISAWIAQTKIGVRSLWNQKRGLYYARDLHRRRFIKVDSVSSLLPLFSHEISKEKAALLAAKIREIIDQNPLIYMVPSTFPGQSSFEPVRYWRGPVWIIINALLADGLTHYGYHNLAKRISLDSLKLVYQSLNDRGGFYEYFDPLTGRGLGSPLQSWTAASVFALADVVSLTNGSSRGSDNSS
jgi:hypothetical protein